MLKRMMKLGGKKKTGGADTAPPPPPPPPSLSPRREAPESMSPAAGAPEAAGAGTSPSTNPFDASPQAAQGLFDPSSRVEPALGMPTDAEKDAILESTVNLALDYLANEGLQKADLFFEKAPDVLVEAALSDILGGTAINFVALDDAPLCCGLLYASLATRPTPIFPVALLDTLAEAHRAGMNEPPERQHEKTAAVLVDGVRDGAVLPVFLNILGLLNLVQQNAPSNGASIEVLSEELAPLMVQHAGAGISKDTREWRFRISRAKTVLGFLISNVYTMFPPQGSESSAPPKQGSESSAPPPAAGTPLDATEADLTESEAVTSTKADPPPAAAGKPHEEEESERTEGEAVQEVSPKEEGASFSSKNSEEKLWEAFRSGTGAGTEEEADQGTEAVAGVDDTSKVDDSSRVDDTGGDDMTGVDDTGCVDDTGGMDDTGVDDTE
ncbi:hypothetical protein T484DRAFT_2026352, partial [Baffinella frigidus]